MAIQASGSVSATTAAPAPRWTELHPANHPTPRQDAGITYDAADGYVVLFGGNNGSGGTNPSCQGGVTCCFNDTWIFQNGNWTRLTIPEPPPACNPAMAYDPAEGYVVAYIGLTSPGVFPILNETWKFSHGTWTRIVTPEPYVTGYYAAATYDPALRAVVLLGLDDQTGWQTWTFAQGTWSQLNTTQTPGESIGWSQLAYDPVDGYPVILGVPPEYAAFWSVAPNETYGLDGVKWIREGYLPAGLSNYTWKVGFSGVNDWWGLAPDPKDGYVLLFGGPPVIDSSGNYVGELNMTWSYRGGVWTNESIPGPSPRYGTSMVFDSTDGYVLLFGGASGIERASNDPTYPTVWNNDTWIYTAPPMATQLSVHVTPTAVCSASGPDCGLPSDVARLTLGVSVTAASGTTSWGTDSGLGSVTYGPTYWLDAPELTFVGWGNLSPAGNLDPTVTCTRDDGGPNNCSTSPVVVGIGNGSTEALQWWWSTPSEQWWNALQQGDTWTISFNVIAEGPPYGWVPVDACVTSACRNVSSGAVAGYSTNFTHQPTGNGTGVGWSYPLGEVRVLPPLSSPSPTPTPAPPPPAPPPTGSPAPVPVVSPPTALPAPPVAVGISVGAGTGVSLSIEAMAAGILSAGVTRIMLLRRMQLMAVASRVGARKGDAVASRWEW